MNQTNQPFRQLVSQLAKNSRQLCLIILLMIFVMSCLADPIALEKSESGELISINFHQTDIAIILQALADNKQMSIGKKH